MKKISVLALSATALLLGACSDEKVVAPVSENGQYNLVPGESSFIAIGIAMPGDPVTRANEDLVDGDATEYAVNDAKLVLFKGANELSATLVNAYDINLTMNNEDGDQVPGMNQEGTDANGFGEITSTSQKVIQEIENPNLGEGENLYAYVILNSKNTATGINYNPQTFQEFKNQILHAIGIDGEDEANGQGAIGANGLVMTSVPVSATEGGTKASEGPVTTLAKLNAAAIYGSYAEAAKEGAALTACVYVERAAVKVELKSDLTKATLSDNTEVKFEILGWALGNVNNNASGYYNTRNFDDAWLGLANAQANPNTKYRFVGRTSFFAAGVDNGQFYRTYFGQDVNFDGKDGLIKAQLQEADYKTFGTENILYTYENTFNEDEQIYANTTYVGIKAKLGDGDVFYTFEGQPNTMLDKAGVEIQIRNSVGSDVNTLISALTAAISADLKKNAEDGRKLPTDITKVDFKVNPVVTFKTPETIDADGNIAYTWAFDITDVKDQAGVALSDANITIVKGLVDASNWAAKEGTSKVKVYKGGVAYYAVRIAHFGADDNAFSGVLETPWSSVPAAANNYAQIYPLNGQSLDETNYGESRKAAWLGRWGIVRNNWYVLEIGGVRGLGTPVPVDYSGTGEGEPGSTPDDNPELNYYISAHVHILPWVKRYQQAEL